MKKRILVLLSLTLLIMTVLFAYTFFISDKVTEYETDRISGTPFSSDIKATSEYIPNTSAENSPQNDAEEIIKTAEKFRQVSDTVDYRTIDEEYNKKFLYYFSSAVNAEESLKNWLTEIRENKVVSESMFKADKTTVNMDKDSYTVIRGTFYIKYDEETNPEYLLNKGLLPGVWYSREEEILLYIAVDDHKWERSEWVIYKGYGLSAFKEVAYE